MNIAATPEAVQLVTIPDGTALSVFTTEKAMDPFLAKIRKELDAFVPDITTSGGRKAIASMAYNVAKSKTYLESVGKALADEQKEIPKKIDACRKTVRDTLDKWRDEVRKPLTDWEAAEDARVLKHTDIITSLNNISRNAVGMDSAHIKEGLDLVDDITIGPACEEFEADYARAKDAARASLMEELPKAEKREAEAAELLVLREQAAKRAEEDRIAAIQREAAEKATKDAQADAQRKIDAEREASGKAQRDADAQVAKAKADAEAADKRAAETEARLKLEAEQKLADDKTESDRREANKKHCGAINRKAVTAFVKGGMTEKAAMQAVTLIALKAVPNITIFY